MSAFTSTGAENRMVWDRHSRGFMEVWYATVGHTRSGSAAWIRYTVTAPRSGDPFCELWGFWFDPLEGAVFSAKERFSLDHLGRPRDDGSIVRIGNAWLSENHLEGAVGNGAGSMEWSLDIVPAVKTLQHIPKALRGRGARSAGVLCSPNLHVPFTGTVKVGGEVFEFSAEPGCQTHRWGRRHPASWAWAHCAAFEGRDDAVLEAVGARSTLGIVPMPTLTFLYLRHRGEEMAFNSDVRSVLRARSRYEMPTWAFTARNERFRVVGAARVNVDRMVQVRYEDPDGTDRHCANSEVADLAIEIYRVSDGLPVHVGSLTALRTAHLEFGRVQSFMEMPISF